MNEPRANSEKIGIAEQRVNGAPACYQYCRSMRV